MFSTCLFLGLFLCIFVFKKFYVDEVTLLVQQGRYTILIIPSKMGYSCWTDKVNHIPRDDQQFQDFINFM